MGIARSKVEIHLVLVSPPKKTVAITSSVLDILNQVEETFLIESLLRRPVHNLQTKLLFIITELPTICERPG